MTKLNPSQTIAALHYGGGDYAHVTDDRQAEKAGDTLFLFIMRELAECEDCADLETAKQRMENAIRDVQVVLDALEDPDNEPCRKCGAVPGTSDYGTVGDGFDGLCPSCADKAEAKRLRKPKRKRS